MEKLPHKTDNTGDDEDDHSSAKAPKENLGNTPKNADTEGNWSGKAEKVAQEVLKKVFRIFEKVFHDNSSNNLFK